MVHEKPIVGSNCRAIMGNMTPPVTEPQALIPTAMALFLRKYVDMMAKAGQNMQPSPVPMHSPWARMNCQYFVQKDVQITPEILKMLPMMKTCRK